MSLFSRLFGGGGGGSEPDAQPEEYEGFQISPTPIRDGSKWRISAKIEKTVDGETKTHTLIRADTLDSLEDAQSASVGKAKVMIDQQGERIFD